MSFELPTGRIVEIDGRGKPVALPADEGAPRFAQVRALLASRKVSVRDARGEDVDLGALALADFHALRALLTRLGWLREERVTITCRNCAAPIDHLPCAALPLGPFEDHELYDPELDAPPPFGEPHPVPGLGDVVLAPLTVSDAAPLHAALTRRRLRLGPPIARAMGIVSIGASREPSRIARLLARAPDDAWGRVTDLFLEAHYPARLFSIAVCPGCGARNDVDAPYDREFEVHVDSREEARTAHESNAESFPSFDEFDAAAGEMAARILRDLSGGKDEGALALVVEAGVPACDDGGEPLLGSFVPGYEGDMSVPSRSPEITVFYRTFRAIWDEEGAYDWRGELEETIVHELEHHVADLAGDDPMDDEERAEIAREQARIVGSRAVVRGEVQAMSADFRGFARRTWPIWLLLLVVTIVIAYVDVR